MVVLPAPLGAENTISLPYFWVNGYSIFWICSLIFSISSFIRTEECIMEVEIDFEEIVFVSLFISWQRKFNFYPLISFFKLSLKNLRWLLNLTLSSVISALSAISASSRFNLSSFISKLPVNSWIRCLSLSWYSLMLFLNSVSMKDTFLMIFQFLLQDLLKVQHLLFSSSELIYQVPYSMQI